MEVFTVIGVLLSSGRLSLAALRWGVDSNDGSDSPEWDRRRAWRGLVN